VFYLVKEVCKAHLGHVFSPAAPSGAALLSVKGAFQFERTQDVSPVASTHGGNANAAFLFQAVRDMATERPQGRINLGTRNVFPALTGVFACNRRWGLDRQRGGCNNRFFTELHGLFLLVMAGFFRWNRSNPAWMKQA